MLMGAGVAASLAMGAVATPAHAGTDAEWNALATCESGQRWGINTGNGYYGGLQFSKGSWDWAGGQAYAAYPHHATREEQVAVAERLLDKQDVSSAWPSCSSQLGLDQSAMQSGSATPPGGSAAPAPDPAPAAAATGTHTVVAGDTLSAIARRYDVAGGYAAVFDANRDVLSSPNVIHVGQVLALPGATASSTPAAAPEPVPAQDAAQSDATHLVRSGDTLSGIARKYGIPGGWQALHDANRDTISNPNVIHVNQRIVLPA